MVWTILGQDRISGKLETFVMYMDGAGAKNKAIEEASRSVEVLAVIQGNHEGAVTLCSPYRSELRTYVMTEEERVNKENFKRCSEYWEGI